MSDRLPPEYVIGIARNPHFDHVEQEVPDGTTEISSDLPRRENRELLGAKVKQPHAELVGEVFRLKPADTANEVPGQGHEKGVPEREEDRDLRACRAGWEIE